MSLSDFTGNAPAFASGATLVMPTITIDTTGLVPGSYAVGAGLTGSGDGILNPGMVDLSAEYVVVAATIHVIPIPEPGTGVLTVLGLAGVALARRRRAVC